MAQPLTPETEQKMQEWFKKVQRVRDTYMENTNYKRNGLDEQPSFAFNYDGVSTSISGFNSYNFGDIILKPLREKLRNLNTGQNKVEVGVTIDHKYSGGHNFYTIEIEDYAAEDARPHFYMVTIYKDRTRTQMIYDIYESKPIAGTDLFIIYAALNLQLRSIDHYAKEKE